MSSFTVNIGESAYNRSKELSIDMDSNIGVWCDSCKKNSKNPVLSMDTSDGEYGSISLCKTCISNYFKKVESKV